MELSPQAAFRKSLNYMGLSCIPNDERALGYLITALFEDCHVLVLWSSSTPMYSHHPVQNFPLSLAPSFHWLDTLS